MAEPPRTISAHLMSSYLLVLLLILLSELRVEVSRLISTWLESYRLGDLALLNCLLVVLVDYWGMSVASQLLLVVVLF
jgi:hypothetical protein